MQNKYIHLTDFGSIKAKLKQTWEVVNFEE